MSFKVKRVVKYRQNPSIYKVTVKLATGEEKDVAVPHAAFYRYDLFQKEAFSQLGVPLPSMKQSKWEGMVPLDNQDVELVEVSEEPNKDLDAILRSFLSVAMEPRNASDVVTDPCKDKMTYFFKTHTFVSCAGANGIRLSRKEAADYLQRNGFKIKTKRVFGGLCKVWEKDR